MQRLERVAGLTWAARLAGKLHAEGAIGETLARRGLLESAKRIGLTAQLGDEAVDAILSSGWRAGVRS